MAEAADDGFPQAVQEHFKLSDQLSYAAAASTMELDLQHHLAFNTPWNSTWANSNHDTIPFSFIGDLPPSDSNPLFHFNVLPQPPLFGELFQSVPHGYSLSTSSGGGTEYQEGDGERLESTKETGERTKHYATAREKRTNLNDRYKFLGSLVPKPSKPDRASVVGDSIDYIKELVRTVDELKLLKEKRSRSRERSIKRHNTDQDDASEESYNNGSLRSSWIQRKSKDTEIDVRIVHDQVTITLQRKKMDCLLFVSKVLDELHLDLQHVASGQIGDYYSFLFNAKIYEGASVHAGAIANKLIEVMDTEYAAIPTSSY
ncbi:hypothetical protein Pint_04002 [Pistacia integerrima]|uniref:Uncharacterized protein n=1 Tax=Pistacia integerrima TaxID=434235 RepID=A0ACC0Z2N9_9ROSI|nr:hypothetical protein Pint_04002 [Pistacia integerrima]